MTLKLAKIEVGPWPMNTYILMCETTGSIAVVDPGADIVKILNTIDKVLQTSDKYQESHRRVQMILVTHGHPDHVGALEELRAATSAPVYIHPFDAESFSVQYDRFYEDNEFISLGDVKLKAIHTPGHTPGSTCIDLGDQRVLVGDTIFVGGPGKTLSPSEFEQTMKTMKSVIFKWSDDTIFFPGHGDHGRIGDERPKFEAFSGRGYPDTLFGDVIWE